MAATGRASRWRRVSLLWHYLHTLAKLAVISCSTVLYGLWVMCSKYTGAGFSEREAYKSTIL